MSIPAPPDNCWPVDTSCCAEFEDAYEFDVQERSIALAAQTMRALTLYQVGGCPITVRPCTHGKCGSPSTWYSGAFYPVNWAGEWSNCGCATASCVHHGIDLATIGFGPIVGPIETVRVDGAVLVHEDDYLVSGTILYRADGTAWPTEQDMLLPDTAPGTWSITYLPAHEVDGLGAYAAGVLACEYAKACSGSECRLPDGVISIVRAGIQLTLTPGSFPAGFTGIAEVDAYLRRWNPYGLKVPPSVYVPGGEKALTWRS